MKTTVYNDMKAMAIGGIYVFTWLLMALSVRAQCESRGFPDSGSDKAELIENIRFDIECNKTEAKLSLSSGGIYVTDVYIFEECMITGHNNSDVSTPGGSQIRYEYLGSAMDEREILVAPNSEILAATDLECSYYGCYIADNREHIFPYVLTLEEIKCNFTKEIAASSSSLPQHTETSMNMATLIYHTSTQKMSSTAAMRGMQQSSISAVKLQSTPVTIPSEELTSISSQSFDTPTPPTLASSAIQGSGNTSLQWMALLILFPVALCTLLGFCLVLRRVDTRQEKIKFQQDIHAEWIKWQNEEPLDVDFFPVPIDLQLKSPSFHSLDTVLNELDCIPTSSHTTLPGDPNSTSISRKIINGSISCGSNVGQNSDTDGEEHLHQQQTTRSRARDENLVENLHPATVDESEKQCLTQLLDPLANAYNYSMDSREYVLVSGLSCSGGSGSTMFTTIGSDCEDLCTPAEHNNNTRSSCDSALS